MAETKVLFYTAYMIFLAKMQGYAIIDRGKDFVNITGNVL